jgi:hypothetical protein
MASAINQEPEEFSYIQCPFRNITGCDFAFMIKGYCTKGQYCIQNCAYAWMTVKDNA